MADGRQEFPGALATGPGKGYRSRGAGLNPRNRFEVVQAAVLGEYLDGIAAERGGTEAGEARIATQVIRDRTRSIINRVDPIARDVGYNWSLNPYRGCEHGCIYCYARPTHEYLGYSCGLDFETKILAKLDAPRMLERELADPKWCRETLAMCSVTDAYQPIEGRLGLTRGCLEVLAKCRQPVSVISKSGLMLRDVDLFETLSRYSAIHVTVTLVTLDVGLARRLEPRAAPPDVRLRMVQLLREAKVPVQVMVAPVIPGITDVGIPRLLEAAADAGAQWAGYEVLRLPYQLKALYEDWLRRWLPQRAEHALALLRQVHGGKLYDATIGRRMRGSGIYAEHLRKTFNVFRRKYHLDKALAGLAAKAFQPPGGAQLRLFSNPWRLPWKAEKVGASARTLFDGDCLNGLCEKAT